MERDAFGRKKGEDTLAEMGWRTPSASGAATATPRPAGGRAATAPGAVKQPEDLHAAMQVMAARLEAAKGAVAAAPPSRPQKPAPRRRRTRRRRWIFFAVVALLWIVPVRGLDVAVESGRDAVDDLREQVTGASPNADPAPTTSAVGALPPDSLFRANVLRAALAKLPEGRIAVLNIRPDFLTAVVVRGRTERLVTLKANGEVLADVRSPVTLDQPTVEVDPAAPARIARAVARMEGMSVADVPNLVLTAEDWAVTVDGRVYRADPSGRIVKRAG